MKRILSAIFIILFSINTNYAQDLLETIEVNYNLYAIENPEGGNVSFLITRKGIVVVDAGANPSNAERIINTIKSISNKPIKYLILTHMHGDHIYGLSAFPQDVTIIAHKNLENNNTLFNEKNLINYKEKVFPNYLSNIKLQLDSISDKESSGYTDLLDSYNKNKAYFEDIQKIQFRSPDITFDDYYRLKVGNERIMLEYPGPCHTSDNIVVKFSNHNVIHTGDIVFRKEFPYTIEEHGVDIYNWVKTLDDLYKENILTVIPGHGEIDNKYALKEQAEYFKQLAQKIERLKTQGLSLEEIIARCKASDYDLQGNENQLPVNITVIYNQLIHSPANWWEF